MQGPAKPDDLLDGCRPTPAAKKHADALATCDLECLLIQLGGDTPRNRELLRELRRFLVLKAITQDGDGGTPPTLSPSTMVDRGWHALMLRPRLYLTVCAALGSPDVIDHDPMGGKACEPLASVTSSREPSLHSFVKALHLRSLVTPLPPCLWSAGRCCPRRAARAHDGGLQGHLRRRPSGRAVGRSGACSRRRG